MSKRWRERAVGSCINHDVSYLRPSVPHFHSFSLSSLMCSTKSNLYAMVTLMVVLCVDERIDAAAVVMCFGDRAVVTIFAGSGARSFSDGSGANVHFSAPYGVAVDASGNVFVADSNNARIRKVTASGGTRISPVTLHARVADSHVHLSAYVRGP
jgi:hypothetical protein